jgi:hypothetical protein
MTYGFYARTDYLMLSSDRCCDTQGTAS